MKKGAGISSGRGSKEAGRMVKGKKVGPCNLSSGGKASEDCGCHWDWELAT